MVQLRRFAAFRRGIFGWGRAGLVCQTFVQNSADIGAFRIRMGFGQTILGLSGKSLTTCSSTCIPKPQILEPKP